MSACVRCASTCVLRFYNLYFSIGDLKKKGLYVCGLQIYVEVRVSMGFILGDGDLLGRENTELKSVQRRGFGKIDNSGN